jgi:hypothetical protein
MESRSNSTRIKRSKGKVLPSWMTLDLVLCTLSHKKCGSRMKEKYDKKTYLCPRNGLVLLYVQNGKKTRYYQMAL